MRAVIILAAGNSTRMKSCLPKVLHPLAGKLVIQYVLDAAATLNPSQVIVVTSEALKNHPILQPYTPVVQNPALGTGHAVQCAMPYLKPEIEDVFIMCGDTPLITPETLADFSKMTDPLALLAMKVNPNTSYGRLIIDAKDRAQRIVEMKDATDDEKKLPLANTGVYKIKRALLNELIPTLSNQNASGEYYLTDLVEKTAQKNMAVGVLIADADEFHGINTRADLAKATHILQNRWRDQLMNEGVTLVQPETVHFSYDTKISKDVTIHPFVTMGPGVTLDTNVTVFPFCHLENCHLEMNASVGPFAHLRGGAVLKEGASVGNFVEVKKSTLGRKTKAKHLSYIGDATLGDNVNIGAGTITCNYDGVQKFETIVDDNASIGANTSLVAPVYVGKGAIVAAGSVITQNVDADDLALGRARQVNKPKGADKLRQKQKKS